jgi:D-sedoheptulose 7-phosphate isomerase
VQHLVLHCICDGVDAQLLGLPDTLSNEMENPA